jgi:hypothetical protein
VVRTFFDAYLEACLHVRRHHNGVEPGVGGRYVVARYTRASMLDMAARPYVVVARAKGLGR